MNLKELKEDRKQLLELRKERSNLRWGIDKAVTESKHSGTLHSHDYRDTWDITHPKSGEPFKANSNWFRSFGTDDEKKFMSERRRILELSIHAKERQRCDEIDKEIGTLYQKYDCLLNDLEFRPCEGSRYDGENDFGDILLVAQRVIEHALIGVVVTDDDMHWGPSDVKSLHNKVHELLTTLSAINTNITHCPFCQKYIKSF